ncbi:MAG: radical SAM protein, partial [Nitrospinaceae bacterium]|nr:radical SAM protein [Nitrospinaceae bacterium]NIS83637.1 radical SAM protein [Nitrospinaceae bacterium]NIT80427.1 radical SAM protein [Nitrospinaceae bacterium]NIU94828.1 radical SAM protein [Nitrospinaceae bacterium]NIY13421.1 radical SAM protein [Nitrospinaceae bacterium]
AMLAGGFSPTACDVRIYSEHHSGPLQDPARLGWPDLLVLTGLTSSFDRMRHLTAYARTLNPRVIVAAGGPPIRALPRYARRFFDYVCEGDVEQIRDVVRDAWGAGYTADPGVPRYDLISQHYRFLGYLESSRHCNFRCQFCSLTGENARYRKYDLETLRRQFQALGKKKYLLFIDNNFYGNDRRFFLDRLELLKEFREQGFFQAWSALVTDDFFLDETNLARVKESGCYSLFSGVESFDPDVLRGYHKTQNTIVPQVESIRKCLEAGIVFHYGIMFDPARRPLENLRRELEFILDTPGLPLPSFFTLSIPLPGTPYFQECVSERRLLPRVKMRDLDGFTLVSHPRDPMERVVPFVRDLETLRGYRARVIRKAVQLIRAYHRRLTPFQLWLAVGNAFLLCA